MISSSSTWFSSIVQVAFSIEFVCQCKIIPTMEQLAQSNDWKWAPLSNIEWLSDVSVISTKTENTINWPQSNWKLKMTSKPFLNHGRQTKLKALLLKHALTQLSLRYIYRNSSMDNSAKTSSKWNGEETVALRRSIALFLNDWTLSTRKISKSQSLAQTNFSSIFSDEQEREKYLAFSYPAEIVAR